MTPAQSLAIRAIVDSWFRYKYAYDDEFAEAWGRRRKRRVGTDEVVDWLMACARGDLIGGLIAGSRVLHFGKARVDHAEALLSIILLGEREPWLEVVESLDFLADEDESHPDARFKRQNWIGDDRP